MKIRTIIFLTAFALGTVPILSLVAINLAGHMERHEQVLRQSMQDRAGLLFSKLNSSMDFTRKTFQRTLSIPEFEQLLTCRNPTDRACLTIQDRLLKLLEKWFEIDSDCYALFLWDRDGTERLRFVRSKDNAFSASLTEQNNAPLVLKKVASCKRQETRVPDAVISHSAHNTATGTSSPALLTITIPLFDKNEECIGLSRLSLHIHSFLNDFTDSFLIDMNGKIILQVHEKAESAHPVPSLYDRLVPTANKLEFQEFIQKLQTPSPFSMHTDRDFSVNWIPLALEPAQTPLLWIGSIVDRSEAMEWKKSLIRNIVTIVSFLTLIVFFIAKRISTKTDQIKTDILNGVDRILNSEESVRFSWRGPQELHYLANELTDLCSRYAQSREGRQKAENDLFESEEKFRNLTASARDAIIMVDPQGKISFWNRAATNIFGFSNEEALGKPVYALISPRLLKNGDTSEKPYESDDGPISETMELRARNKDGAVFPIELSLSEASIHDQFHSIWIIRDITVRTQLAEQEKLQQQQLIQADKMISLGLLVAGVAHEINNPNSITLLNIPMLTRAWLSVAPILEEYYLENGDFLVGGIEYREMREQVPRLFKEVKESAKRIRHIVSDLKDYARKDTTLLMDSVNLNEVADESCRLADNLIKKSTTHFRTDFAPELPLIKGNKQRLKQVIINLLQNSCEALEDSSGGLALSTFCNEKEKTVSITVYDQGTGIPKDKIDKITDPFFTTKRPLGGTGLGLSVSASIVKEHNGILTFESEPGKGTKATVTFPAIV